MIKDLPGNRAVNPFATSLVGLGRVGFLQEFDGQLAEIVQRTIAASHRGQIVGPHGSGKTTLSIAIARFLSELPTCGKPTNASQKPWRPKKFVWLVAMPARWPWLPARFRVQLRAHLDAAGRFQIETGNSNHGEMIWKDVLAFGKSELVFVDGLELLWRWQRAAIVNCVGKHIIFTVHQRIPGQLPILAELRPGLALFEQLVQQLVGNFKNEQGAMQTPPICVSDAETEMAFRQSEGDMRKGLALLYDLWETKTRRIQRLDQLPD